MNAEHQETLVSLFADQVAQRGHRPALRYRSGGLWRSRSWAEWLVTVRSLAAGLVDLGVELGDRIAILSRTRRQWVEADLAIVHAAAATVPVYPTLRADVVGQILRDSGTKIIFAEDPAVLEEALGPEAGELPMLEAAVVFDSVSRLLRPDRSGRMDVRVEDVAGRVGIEVLSLVELAAAGDRLLRGDPEVLSRRATELEPSSLAAVYYTSGTSGEPKGVMLTHDNFCFETEQVSRLISVGPSDEQLLFLPLAHIVAKLTVMLQLRMGFVTSFADGFDQVAADCAEVRPTFIVGVPRVFEKLEEAILGEIRERQGLERRALEWALEVGRRVSGLERAGEIPQGRLALESVAADRLLFARVRRKLGGRVRFMLSGAAPLGRETAEFFHTLGLLVLEGYGLTETTGASALNLPDRFRFGTVGPAVPGLDVEIAEDGEILLRGRSVTPGYWDRTRPGTASRDGAFDARGFFRTGDIGAFDDDGFLKITDRKKDIIITAGGKNLAPQRIERILMRDPLVDRAVVFGDRRRFAVALLSLDVAELSAWAETEGLRGDRSAQLRHPKLRARIGSAVEDSNAQLARFEWIRRFEVLEGGFGDILTPTGKVKRRLVHKRFYDRVESLYGGPTADLEDPT